MAEDYMHGLKCSKPKGRGVGGEENKGWKKLKESSPDVSNAVLDDKECGDSSSSVHPGFWGDYIRRRIVRKGAIRVGVACVSIV